MPPPPPVISLNSPPSHSLKNYCVLRIYPTPPCQEGDHTSLHKKMGQQMPHRQFVKFQKRTARQSVVNILLYLTACLAILYGVSLVSVISSKPALGFPSWIFPSSSTAVEECLKATDAALRSYDQDVREFLSTNPSLKSIIKRKRFRTQIEIDRVPESELSFQRFHDEYEVPGVPVVITNMSRMTGNVPWTREHIKRVCGSAKVNPLIPERVVGRTWGNLKESGTVRVSTFIDSLAEHPDPSPYMHDWQIAKNCPRLLENYTVPKYFSQDFLRQVEVDGESYLDGRERPYQESWPSLFIGEQNTGSGIHIDSGATHFVMYMLEGRKEFRVLRRQDRVVAYEDRDKSTFQSSLFKPNFNRHPLLALATVYRAMLVPGDMLFIPGGSPHQVENHSPVIGMSTNFVDSTNVKRAVMQFREQNNMELADALDSMHNDGKFEMRMNPKSVRFSLK